VPIGDTSGQKACKFAGSHGRPGRDRAGHSSSANTMGNGLTLAVSRHAFVLSAGSVVVPAVRGQLFGAEVLLELGA
jgi:hypothetical protein